MKHVSNQTISLKLTGMNPGPYQVDLILDAATLNDRLLEIGLWLVEWQIPHEARIRMLPRKRRLRVSFPDGRHARAFEMQFADAVADPEIESAVP